MQVPAAGDRTGQQHYAARIEARHETVLAFQVGGRVSARLAEVGDTVAVGAVLARIDSSDLRLRERDLAARLAASRAERADAASALRRTNELRPKGFVSQAEFDRVAYRDQAAAAQVEALTAQLGLAARDLAYAALTAPAAGVITARMIEAGQVVGAGQPAFSLAQVGQIEAVFDLPEHQRAGLPDTVQVTLWTQPDHPLTAKVREIAPQAADGSRTYRVRATLPVSDGPPPGLGSSATVAFAGSVALPAIPPTAVLKRDDGQPAVWVVDGQGTVRLRPVTLGPVQGDRVAIAGGLGAGDWVVTAGVHDLRDGQAVNLP
ncbi:efflux RND transporter periplasmic adaptor subunit [Immundisolibacter sp.]|uniref:efflux RND transporter periplasmic adaptor subunit n=1 Tax=Immundisolibacter sp. TaxID=1934948 RepID=UPI002B279401|nr:efflux RND transporter periplasmic adaptor subunit [Immundisolibacter sp.]